MKNTLPPDIELQMINAETLRRQNNHLWLALSAIILLFAYILVIQFEINEKDSIKKESPKRELQADFNAY